MRIFPILLFFVWNLTGTAHAVNVWAHRAATVVDVPQMVVIYNAVIDAGLTYPPGRGHYDATAMATYLTNWDATQVVLADGVVVGFWGSLDWTKPEREAIVAFVDVPYLDPSFNAANRLRTARECARSLRDQLAAARSAGDVAPTFLRVYIPRAFPAAKTILTNNLECQVLSSATENGTPVLDEIRCDLPTIDAALRGVGL